MAHLFNAFDTPAEYDKARINNPIIHAAREK
jgi:hypothetical protein